MEQNEIIKYTSDNINNAIEKSLKYAIISLPFTINRMNLSIADRIKNIAKGKLAEYLFYDYCLYNNIPINVDDCTTPFWTIDKRDFIFLEYECDLKNNYFWDVDLNQYTNNELIIRLPALVPNKHKNDQWGKRNEKFFNKNVMFIFTFIKNGKIVNGERRDTTFSVNLTKTQEDFIMHLCREYQGYSLNNSPYDENWFWQKFGNINYIVHEESDFTLYITAYSTNEHFDLFKNTNGQFTHKNYINYPFPSWYTQSHNGAKFLNGAIYTKIVNATVPLILLPSFKSLLIRKKIIK